MKNGKGPLDKYIGQRVGIVRTGKGKATVVGYVTIAGKVEYNTEKEFWRDRDKHKIRKKTNPTYYWNGKKKVGYILENPVKLDVKDQYEVSERGIVARDIDPDIQVRNATRRTNISSKESQNKDEANIDTSFYRAKDSAGNEYTVIRKQIVSKGTVRTKPELAEEIVKNYLISKIGEYRIKENGKSIFIDRITSDEYTSSVNTMRTKVNDVEKTAKFRATTEIEDIIWNAHLINHSVDYKGHTKADATRGYDYYRIRFAFESEGTYHSYSADMIVRKDRNGNDYLYDIQIKKRNHRANLSPIEGAGKPALDSEDMITEDKKKSRKSSRDVTGYHAGDLGKSEDLSQQSGNRGTGHFGTGTYFVGNEEKISDGYYGNRKHYTVNFKDYDLLRPSSEEAGLRLHDALAFFNNNRSISHLFKTTFEERYGIKAKMQDASYDIDEGNSNERKAALEYLKDIEENTSVFLTGEINLCLRKQRIIFQKKNTIPSSDGMRRKSIMH